MFTRLEGELRINGDALAYMLVGFALVIDIDLLMLAQLMGWD